MKVQVMSSKILEIVKWATRGVSWHITTCLELLLLDLLLQSPHLLADLLQRVPQAGLWEGGAVHRCHGALTVDEAHGEQQLRALGPGGLRPGAREGSAGARAAQGLGR